MADTILYSHMAYHAPAHYLFNPAFHTNEIRQAMDDFNDRWLELHSTDSDLILHHYTTLEGLRGIIGDRGIRCGHASSFNDPLEINYGQALVCQVLEENIVNETQEEIRAFFNNLLINVRSFDSILFNPFIACFCESGELLSQWRSYAARGGGYCLGLKFSDDTLISSNLSELGEGKKPFLRKVMYDEGEQRDLVRSYLKQVTDAAKEALTNSNLNKPMNRHHLASVMAMDAINLLLDMILTFKHHAFSEEKEWRFFRVTRDDYQPESIGFNYASEGIIPFRLTHVFANNQSGHPEFPLHSVIFGPTLDPIQSKSTIQLLINHLGSKDQPISLPTSVKIEDPGYRLRR